MGAVQLCSAQPWPPLDTNAAVPATAGCVTARPGPVGGAVTTIDARDLLAAVAPSPLLAHSIGRPGMDEDNSPCGA